MKSAEALDKPPLGDPAYADMFGIGEKKFKELLQEKKRLYRVSSNKMQGNIHAKDEKEAEKIVCPPSW
mgnify:CR=1 FL=1